MLKRAIKKRLLIYIISILILLTIYIIPVK